MADYTLSAKVTGDSSGFQKAFTSAESAAKSFEERIKGISAKVSSVGDKISSAGKKMSVITTGFVAGATAGVKYNATIEQLETSFSVMTGSAEKAADIVQELQKLGAETPFEFTDLADTTQLLMNFGFTADEAIDSMQMLGDIAQGSADKMNSIARAYGKMSSAQKVSLEDINMMIDAGFNPLQEISESTGESMKSLYERISDGKMSVDEITAAMQRSTSEGGKYFQSMQAQSQTFSGQMSTLSDNVSSLLGNVTNGIFEKLAQDVLPKVNDTVSAINDAFVSGGFKEVIDTIKEMSPVLDSVITKVESFGAKLEEVGIDPAIFAAAVVGAGPLLMVLGTIVSLAGKAIGVIGGLASIFAVLLSPIGLIVTAIAGLAGGLVYLMKTNQEFQGIVTSVWNAVSSKIQEIVSGIDFNGILDGLKSAVMSLTPVFESIFAVISTIIGTLKEAFSALFEGISSGFSDGVGNVNLFEKGIMTAIGVISPPLKAIILFFQNFGPEIMNVVSVIASNLVPVFSTLGTTIGGLISTVLPVLSSILTSLSPTIAEVINVGRELLTAVAEMLASVLPVVINLFQTLAPYIVRIAGLLGNLVASLAPVISQLIGSLLPVLRNIISVVQTVFGVIMNIVTSAMPAVISIVNVVMSILQAIIPVLSNIISVIASVLSIAITSISNIIAALSPVVAFIGSVISGIISVVSPIVAFIADVIAAIIDVIGTIADAVTGVYAVMVDVFADAFKFVSGIFSKIADAAAKSINIVSSVVSSISSVFSSVFNSVYSTVSSIMNRVRSCITNVFNGIKNAWSGLTSFVGGVFDGVSSAVNSLVSQVKGFVNGVISGINAAIGIINKIPGVSISAIPYLLHGTDNWQGGFAVMNEGGRGELVNLPNGAQVIPHDISVKYAKEAARGNASVEPFDAIVLGEYIVQAVVSQGKRQAEALESGISKMRMVANERETARFVADLGFTRG